MGETGYASHGKVGKAFLQMVIIPAFILCIGFLVVFGPFQVFKGGRPESDVFPGGRLLFPFLLFPLLRIERPHFRDRLRGLAQSDV
ncbi:hypothetical protein HNR65_002689 [Desulfosalsimonas propionicica]|uniref:Uncharacterized protein n=1 Tax=Desulfosalsimonas propionicica TaxID=332175 RepID=A0A7W0HLI1_9BACT|nr:hypothetical protein [Desulfosalsimonas propionicica]